MSEITFESALKRLEEIVGKLEAGEEPLEESLRLFEEAVSLADFCDRQLTEAHGKLEKLVEERPGVVRVEEISEVP